MKKTGLMLMAVVTMTCVNLSLIAQEVPPTNPPPVPPTDTTPLFSGPARTAFDFLTSSSTNWMVVPYGIVNSKFDKFGGGIAVAYKLSEFVAPALRLDYYDGRVWMPSASLQLQAPVRIMNKFELIPFAFSGLATPLSGKGNENGTAVGIFGAGAAIRIGARWDIIGDVEKWSGFEGLQYRMGVVFKF